MGRNVKAEQISRALTHRIIIFIMYSAGAVSSLKIEIYFVCLNLNVNMNKKPLDNSKRLTK